MRSSGLERCVVALTLVGTVTMAVGFSLAVEGVIADQVDQMSRRLAALGGGAAGDDVKECPAPGTGKAGGGAEVDIELTATKGKPLKFKCGVNLSLNPPKENTDFVNVHEYTVTEGTPARKACNTGSKTALATALDGATLKEEPTSESRSTPSPVYIFEYKTEPENDKHFCYTCVTTAPPSTGVGSHRSENSADAVACTVYITVPKKKEETTTSSTITPAPHSPSGCRTMPAGIATALGAFVALILRI